MGDPDRGASPRLREAAKEGLNFNGIVPISVEKEAPDKPGLTKVPG